MEKLVQQSDMSFTKGQLSFLRIDANITFWIDLSPLFGCPVEQADRIEPFFIGTSSSKNYYSIVFRVVIH